MKSRNLVFSLVAICCGAWWSVAPANAVPISDTVWVNTFPMGGINFGEPSETGPFDTGLFPGGGFNPTLAAGLFENAPFVQSNLSDIAWVDQTSGHIFVSSDFNETTFNGVPFSHFAFILPQLETGLPQDISDVFFLAPNTLVVQSVVEATPLPSTWMMLLTGFLGLGFFAYRGVKKKAAGLAAA